MAAQIIVDGIKCKDIANWFYTNGAKGIGIIDSDGIKSLHIDMRKEARFCFEQIDGEIVHVDKF